MSSSTQDASTDYPRNYHDSLGANHLSHYHSELVQDASSLFVSDATGCKIEVREHIPKDNSEVAACDQSCTKSAVAVSTLDGLQSLLEKVLPRACTRIIIIRRENSWSRIGITLDMFRLLCRHSNVTPRFLHFIQGMRRKIAPKDEHFISCYSQLQDATGQNGDTETGAYELCYNIRHFEKHGRDLLDPWSCRQSVVHQKYHFSDATSSWIVIQPPVLWVSSIDEAKLCRLAHPFSLHLCLLSSAMTNFRLYLDYISTELLSVDQQVSFSKPFGDYDFDFSLGQRVHTLKRKLHHVVMILDGNRATLAAISAYAKAIGPKASVQAKIQERFLGELENISHDLHNYSSTSTELLNLSGDIMSMINAILKFRNQEVLRTNEIQLRVIAEKNSDESRSMSQIAKWTYHDSRTMRIATVIALVYLPASVVLAFFSTPFAELRASGPGLSIKEQIWVPVVSILVLIYVNWFMFRYWDRREKKHDPSRSKTV